MGDGFLNLFEKWIESEGYDGAPPCRPGHTPLTAFAPLSSGTKGAGWIPAFAGMTGGGGVRGRVGSSCR